MAYSTPQFESKSFTCPHCEVLAQFHWALAYHEVSYKGLQVAKQDTEVYVAYCQSCTGKMIWLKEKLGARSVYPQITNAPLPHPDMPPEVRTDFEEARSICNTSPRGAAALLRLAVQRLCKHLGEKGNVINDDVASLVKKGLPPKLQQALDIVRVTGNEAVHPGTMDFRDDPDIARRLFLLVNLIVENRISEPSQIEALFQELPPESLRAIKRRDA
jgi:hypothetical protein